MALPPAQLECPQVAPGYVFGLTGEDYPTSLIYSREDTVLFNSGRHLVFENVETKLQKLVIPSETCRKIVSFCVSHGNRYVAICEQSERQEKHIAIGIYKLANMKRLRTLTPEESYQPSVCGFSKNGKYLVTAGTEEESTVIMWEWEKLKAVAPAAKFGQELAKRVSVNPFVAESFIISGTRSVKVFRFTEGTLQSFTPPNVVGSALINDHCWVGPSRYVVACSDSSLRVFDGRNEVRRIDGLFPEGHSMRCLVPIQGDGLLLAGDRGYFSIVHPTKEDSSMYQESRRVRTQSRETIIGVALSPSEECAAFWEENSSLVQLTLAEMDAVRDDEGARTQPIIGSHRGKINGSDLAVHKQILVTVSHDCSVRLWDLHRKSCILMKVFPEEPLAVAIHPMASMVAIAFRRRVVFAILLVNDLTTVYETEIKGCKVMKFSHGGHYLAAVTGTSIALIHSVTFAVVHSFRGHIGPIRSLCFSADDLRMASAGYDGAVYEWDLESGRRVQECIEKTMQWTSVVFANFSLRRADAEGHAQLSSANNNNNNDGGGGSDDGDKETVAGTTRTLSSAAAPPTLSRGDSQTGAMLSVPTLPLHSSAASTSSLISQQQQQQHPSSYQGGGAGGHHHHHHHHQQQQQHILSSCLIACGTGRDYTVIKQIENSQATREFKMSADSGLSPYESLFVSNNGHILFVGCENGRILLSNLERGRFPTGKKELPVSATLMVHADCVRQMISTIDDRVLVSSGDDGVSVIHSVSYRPEDTLEAHKQSLDAKVLAKLETVTNVVRSDYTDTQAKLVELEEQIAKTKQELTLRLREREKELMEDLHELRQQYDRDMTRKASEIDDLRVARTNAESIAKRKVEEIETTQTQLRTEMENAYELKLMAAQAALAQLAEQKDEQKTGLEDELANMRMAYEEHIRQLRAEYETQLEEEAARRAILEQDLDFLRKQHNEESREMFDEQETAMSDLQAKAKRDLEKQKEVSSAAKSEIVYLRNRFAQNRQEVENMRGIVRQKDNVIATHLAEINELTAACDSLRREVIQRDESLMDKERLVNDLKKRNQELEKFRLVFGYKLQGLKKDIEPKDEQIHALLAQVNDMEGEFEREATEKTHLEKLLREKIAVVEATGRELKSAKQRIKDRDGFISQFRSDLSRAIQHSNSDDWKDKVKELYRKYCVADRNGQQGDLEDGGFTHEALREFERQRMFLESHAQGLGRKTVQFEAMGRDNAKKRLGENQMLMEEVNQLRRQNRDLFAQLRQLQSEVRMNGLVSNQGSSSAAAAASVGPSGGIGDRDASVLAADRDSSSNLLPAGSSVSSSSAAASGFQLPQARSNSASGGGGGSRGAGLAVASSEFKPAAGPKQKTRGKLVKGSTTTSARAWSPPFSPSTAVGSAAAANTATGRAASAIAGLLDQMEDNNRLIEMQKYEIKRLREQVAYLLDKTRAASSSSSLGGLGVGADMFMIAGASASTTVGVPVGGPPSDRSNSAPVGLLLPPITASFKVAAAAPTSSSSATAEAESLQRLRSEGAHYQNRSIARVSMEERLPSMEAELQHLRPSPDQYSHGSASDSEAELLQEIPAAGMSASGAASPAVSFREAVSSSLSSLPSGPESLTRTM